MDMNTIDAKIFKAYDIRGIYPSQINEEIMSRIAHAAYTFFSQKVGKEKFTIAVGHDMRESAPTITKAVIETLVSLGADVIDVGLVSTPTFYFAVSHYNYDCGIQITASHNPKEYNGMKFVMNTPTGMLKIGGSTGMKDIAHFSTDETVELAPQKAGGMVTEKTNILEDEVTNALNILDNPKLKHFKIVADPANAMGATYIEALSKRLDIDLVKLYFELDGSFPNHPADPFDFENLKDLRQRVIDEHADFGIGTDGDGDRLFFVDEKGNVIPATIITALISRELLKENPGATILFDIRYIYTPSKIVEENGGKYEVTRVGHAFITEKLKETGGIFAGESSAHYFYKATGNAESQLPTIISVLKVLTEEGKKLSEVVEELRRSYESGEVNFKVTNAQEILDGLKEKYNDGELVTLDGISINYPNWRFNVRTSNTEPLLRLNVESFDQKEMQEKQDELLAFINEHAKTE